MDDRVLLATSAIDGYGVQRDNGACRLAKSRLGRRPSRTLMSSSRFSMPIASSTVTQATRNGGGAFFGSGLSTMISAIFLALDRGVAVGFTQLYPSFSSGAMAVIFILNDLFVVPEARRRGTGSALLQAAAQYGERARARRLVLSTEITNIAAQSLYGKAGWKRNTEFCLYQIAL